MSRQEKLQRRIISLAQAGGYNQLHRSDRPTGSYIRCLQYLRGVPNKSLWICMLDWHLMSGEMLVQPRWQEMGGFVARENCSG